MKRQSSWKSKEDLEIDDGQVVVLIQHYNSRDNTDSLLCLLPLPHTHTERKIKAVCMHWRAGDVL